MYVCVCVRVLVRDSNYSGNSSEPHDLGILPPPILLHVNGGAINRIFPFVHYVNLHCGLIIDSIYISDITRPSKS